MLDSRKRNTEKFLHGGQNQLAAGTQDMGADYEALRRDIVDVLAERRSQGRLSAAGNTDQVSREFHADLARSVADILVPACPNAVPYAAVLTDAQSVVDTVLAAAS